ncbi:unnamed protein product [Polarella glacialis]|uniref:Uncharacterized protein n=1 Tax=Polarella glacialis TaxID=89957 RepID=A0A813H0I5_POLGL|nr:unnamed protein product [Polarella glacialis]|mmetsp:Transcript_51566/g.83655  ORF Transcript_51566/g.83655 Transcript_51566/m.83655 type:complete len:115 (-) Transcript_51566:235-579(-)
MPRSPRNFLAHAVVLGSLFLSASANLAALRALAPDMLELDDADDSGRCAVSFIQVLGGRVEDMALMKDDECFAFGTESDHLALSALSVVRKENSAGKKSSVRRVPTSKVRLSMK